MAKDPTATTSLLETKPLAHAPGSLGVNIPVAKSNPVVINASPNATKSNSIFNFGIKSIKIVDTRSLHKDTVFVSISIAVGSKPPVVLPPLAMGDLNSGTFPVNLSIPNVEVGPTETVAFVYSILNTGFKANVLEQKIKGALAKEAADAATKAGTLLGSSIGGPIGGSLGSVVGSKAGSWLVDKILNLIFPNCDGPVAGATHAYSGAQLASQTEGGKLISITDDNKGTDSPHGCGSNSRYLVSWSVSGRPKN